MAIEITNAQSASLRRFLAAESNATENKAAESNAVWYIQHSSNGRWKMVNRIA